ncbi:MAG: hypothetical protein ACF8NJ_04500 [Phycisphaerales bacterium JB038]
MQAHRITVAALAGLAASSLAAAAVTPIGQFAGDYFENFEDIDAPGGYPGPFDIFQGEATLNDTLANNVVLATVVSSSDTDWENFYPYDGFLMGLVPTGWCEFVFDTPVTQFGGFFGSAAIMSDGFISFYDEAGALLDTQAFNVTALQWDWQGWESDVAIGRIEIHGHSTPGKPLVFDNMALIQVPAPGSLALLLAGAALRRRQR